MKTARIIHHIYFSRTHSQNIPSPNFAESLTQEDIAKRTGLKKQNISRFENGTASPTLNTVSRYAVALGGTFEFKKLH